MSQTLAFGPVPLVVKVPWTIVILSSVTTTVAKPEHPVPVGVKTGLPRASAVMAQELVLPGPAPVETTSSLDVEAKAVPKPMAKSEASSVILIGPPVLFDGVP
jgi:hypothetical protein